VSAIAINGIVGAATTTTALKRLPRDSCAYDFGRLIGGTTPLARYAVTSLP
jgi:hypothetical protein